MLPPSRAPQVLVPAEIELPPKQTTDVAVQYRPLLVGTSEASLSLQSKELGTYDFALKLVALDITPERSVGFSVPLGARDTQVYRFTHWSDQKCDYSCTFASGTSKVFECQPTISVEGAGPNGREVELQVHFEPSTLGENIRDMLVINSPVGGRYQCPVMGRCIPPKPQGPVEFAGGAAKIDFKNVFASDADFMMSCDNPSFTVKPSEKIGSKKAIQIAVAYKEVPGASNNGRLTVTCPSLTQSTWVYYLSLNTGKK